MFYSVTAPITIACDSPYDALVTTPGSIVQSPNYPRKYESGKDCRVTIKLASWILLSFLDFDIEAHKNCAYDYLAIYDGPNDTSRKIGTRLCGSTTPTEMESTGNAMHILFHTDSDDERTGFRMKISQIGRCISIHKTLWM